MPRTLLILLLGFAAGCAHRGTTSAEGQQELVAPWPPADDLDREAAQTAMGDAKSELRQGITPTNAQRTYELLVRACDGGIQEGCDELARRARASPGDRRIELKPPESFRDARADLYVVVECSTTAAGVVHDCVPVLDDPYGMTAAYIAALQAYRGETTSFEGFGVARRSRFVFVGPTANSRGLQEARERVQKHPDSGSAWRHLAVSLAAGDKDARELCAAAAKGYALLRREPTLAEVNARCALAENRLVAAEAFAIEAARDRDASARERTSRFLTLAAVFAHHGKCAEARDALERAKRVSRGNSDRDSDRKFIEERCPPR